MADQAIKRRDLVARHVQLAGVLDDLADELAALDAERNQAGAFTEADFAGNEHIDAADLGTLAARYAAIRAPIADGFNRDILRKARRS